MAILTKLFSSNRPKLTKALRAAKPIALLLAKKSDTVLKSDVRYSSHNSHPLVPLLSPASSMRNIRVCCFTINFYITFQSISHSSECSSRVQSTHRAVCHTTGPQPLPQSVRHTVRSSASSLHLQYIRVSSRSSSSCLPLLPHLPVTYILPSIFPSLICFRRQFLRKT